MSTTQQLGGTRQSSPLDDEMTYPLTSDEYLTIKENLSIDKFTNWESFLLTTAITSLISAIVLYTSVNFELHEISNGKEIVKLNLSAIASITIYIGLTIGGLLGFIISKSSKAKSEKPMHRLDTKITYHLNKATNE